MPLFPTERQDYRLPCVGNRCWLSNRQPKVFLGASSALASQVAREVERYTAEIAQRGAY